MSRLSEFDLTDWRPALADAQRERAITDLENGKILYFPRLSFPFEPGEERIFSTGRDRVLAKNISYVPQTGRLKGVKASPAARAQISRVMQRYADLTQALVYSLFPEYAERLRRARTSFRAVEIAGRASSLEKDDTRLHVDAFPSSPTHGERILRVFCNINPSGQTRNWRLGEPFEPYARRFAPRVKRPLPGSFALLNLLGITRSRRSLYDHYMLALHDLGKRDERYQRECPQQRCDFPSGSLWLCFTDEALHAVLSGRYMLEQTFQLPVTAMRHPERSPLRILERLTGRRLSAAA